MIRADELPALLDDASSSEAGAVIGAVDLPDRQRREPLVVDPWGNGALIVLGSAGSGRTTALAMLASVVDAEVRWVADDPAELWQALQLPPGDRRVLVIADDLDRTLAWADAEQRAELGDLLARVAHDARRSGVAVAASARAGGNRPDRGDGAFEQRILLRTASRDDHLLAGGESSRYRAGRRPGSALWRGAESQLAIPVDPSAGPGERCFPRSRSPRGPGRSRRRGRPSCWRGWRQAGLDAALPRVPPSVARITVADVDGWLADHAALAAVRREWPPAAHRPARVRDHRSLTRLRSALPPLASPDEAWLVDGGDDDPRADPTVVIVGDGQARPSDDSSTVRPCAAATAAFTTVPRAR